MPETPKKSKLLEFKLRAYNQGQERPDQRDVSRVYFNADAILEMGLVVGEPCYVWKLEEEEEQRHECIVWQAYQNLSKNGIQMHKSFQETLGFKYDDRIAVTPGPHLQDAPCVVVRDITTIIPLSTRDRPHWEWALENKFNRAQILYHGQRFELSLEGPKRSFVVESFRNADSISINRRITSFPDGSTVRIMDEASLEPQIPNGPLPSLRVPNIAGIEEALGKLNEFLEDLESSHIEPSWGVKSQGVILHGAHGVGKSLIMKNISETGWGKVSHINAETKPSGIRDTFKDATKSPSSIILVHELDLLTPNLSRSLCEEMDHVAKAGSPSNKTAHHLVIVAEAWKLSEVTSSLRKMGRLDTDILIPVPDADARRRIIKSLTPRNSSETLLKLLDNLAEKTHAYTGEDLALLLNKSCAIARRRLRATKSDDLETENDLTQEDLDEALHTVRPSAMHDITLQPPKVRWNEIGGQHAVKKALRRAVETPLKYPTLLQRLGATPKKGLLLYGPPGCSKTLSAQAMATESGFNFFAVKGAELLNMYVGESERAVREIFSRARAAAPSIIFFDEIESIAAARDGGGAASGRGGGGTGGGAANGVNVLTTILNEMDGIETLKGVTVLAATNKPETLDLALLRPGRFDELLYVGPPDAAGREEILAIRKRRMDWEDDVDIAELAGLMAGYSGAEIVGVCNAAVDMTLDRALETGDLGARVSREDFRAAVQGVRRRITAEMVEGYRRWAEGL